MLTLAAVLSLGLLLALGAASALALFKRRRLFWRGWTFRLLLSVTVLAWAGMLFWLWQLPSFAARQGAGTGAPWLAHTLAVGGALLLGLLLFAAAWVLTHPAPAVAGLVPVLVAGAMLLARGVAALGAPAEFYLAADGKLWVAYALWNLVAAAGLLLYAMHAPASAAASPTAG